MMYLTFEVSASVQQVLQLVDLSYDEERILSGLRTGELLTTTWHKEGQRSELTTVNGDLVAYVKSQSMDGEYTDFR